MFTCKGKFASVLSRAIATGKRRLDRESAVFDDTMH